MKPSRGPLGRALSLPIEPEQIGQRVEGPAEVRGAQRLAAAEQGDVARGWKGAIVDDDKAIAVLSQKRR